MASLLILGLLLQDVTVILLHAGCDAHCAARRRRYVHGSGPGALEGRGGECNSQGLNGVLQLLIPGIAFAQDITVIVLLVAGILSTALGLALEGRGGNSWIEGAAIMAAVVVVVGVTAVNNYQKEQQFRALNQLNEDVKVGAAIR